MIAIRNWAEEQKFSEKVEDAARIHAILLNLNAEGKQLLLDALYDAYNAYPEQSPFQILKKAVGTLRGNNRFKGDDGNGEQLMKLLEELAPQDRPEAREYDAGEHKARRKRKSTAGTIGNIAVGGALAIGAVGGFFGMQAHSMNQAAASAHANADGTGEKLEDLHKTTEFSQYVNTDNKHWKRDLIKLRDLKIAGEYHFDTQTRSRINDYISLASDYENIEKTLREGAEDYGNAADFSRAVMFVGLVTAGIVALLSAGLYVEHYRYTNKVDEECALGALHKAFGPNTVKRIMKQHHEQGRE